MIALSSYSTSWCQSKSNISSTGELKNDSVLISYNDLRKANAKMIELKYEKEINDSLRSIIKNDDKIISTYKTNTSNLTKELAKVKKQRNYIIKGGIIALVACITAIITK